MYFGLGGAYCDLCDMSREECHNIDIVEAGFKITRNVEDLHLLFEENSIEDGSVVQNKNDYGVRKGLTAKPIVDHEAQSVQVLHAVLN